MCLPNAQNAAREFHRTCQCSFVGNFSGDHHTAGRIAAAAEIFGRAVDDEIGTELDGPHQIRCRECAVNDKFCSEGMCDLSDGRNI